LKTGQLGHEVEGDFSDSVYENRSPTPLNITDRFVSPDRRTEMRLTLRTLLAYLDDTLGPNEIKTIGKRSPE